MQPQPESRIYLASRSPRRCELLAQIGVLFDLLLFRAPPRADAEVDETPLPGEAPEPYACRVAIAKAHHGVRLIGLRRQIPRAVLAADTTLDVDGAIVGKPVDADDAVDILRRLSGRTHRVVTAVALATDAGVDCVASVSDVRFRTLDDAEICRYVDSQEPIDKAGAYGIQGHAAIFVAEIRGSHSGIVGLPLCETALLLRKSGYPL